ncbi:MAG: hypothetical protein KAJ42_05230, partial [Gemmatimonadetes bacterium]|nr:hypothetical protein [Gemmatimonadota bacterium]
AGVLGAIMSSADTTLISASTILSLNVVSPISARWREGGESPSPQQQLRLTRIFVVVVGAVAWMIASLQGGIISSLLLAYTVFVGGVVLPTLASFWKDRLGVTAAGAMWAVIVGGGAAILGEIRGGGAGASLIPVLLSALVLFGVSLFTRRPSE